MNILLEINGKKYGSLTTRASLIGLFTGPSAASDCWVMAISSTIAIFTPF
jgi:hypothetical protein